MGYAVSTIYGEGQKFASSTDQGSMYLEVSYTNRIQFDPTLNITEPIGQALDLPGAINYPSANYDFFMGRFDGFWIHKLYRNGQHIMTVQSVDQDMFIPVQYDSVESVSMLMVPGGSIPCPDCPVRPPIPAPGVGALLAVGALFAIGRTRLNIR